MYFPQSGAEESDLIHRDDPLRSLSRSQLERIVQHLRAAQRWYRVSAGTYDARMADAEIDAAIKVLD